MGVGITCSSLS